MGKVQRFAEFCKKPSFILALILIAFFLKGLVFAVIIPMFQSAGGDEYVHYATVQYFAEPKAKTWPIITEVRPSNNNKDAALFHYTEEISKYAELTQSREFSGQPHNTPILDEKTAQSVESEMRSGKYLPYFNKYPITIVINGGGGKLAHQIGSLIERLLSNRSIFERTFAIRILAIFYGLIAVLCAYFIALWSGMKKQHALLLTGIVAFQPELAATTAIISYDPLLIAMFSLFLLAAVSILAHGLNWKNSSALVLFAILALLAKSIGGILLFLAAGVIIWGLREKFPALKKISLWKSLLAALLVFLAVFLLAPKKYTGILTSVPLEARGKTITKSISSYFKAYVFDQSNFNRTNITYWGTFGWMDTTIHNSVDRYIRNVEYLSLAGLLALLIVSLRKWKPSDSRIKTWLLADRPFLPKGRFLVLFALIFLLLQLAVRFYDWRGLYLQKSGIGTPGRYFLPTMIAHIILICAGLGMFVRSSRSFEIILKTLFVLMVLLSAYSIFIVIIPRYYL
jgi:hypothetical protein